LFDFLRRLSADANVSQKGIITLVFFITYVIFQPPSTVIVRKVGPRIHLALITLLWGACMIAMGFVSHWDVMAGMRVLLGLLEAGFFPSCVYLLSTWYTRCESIHWFPRLDAPLLPPVLDFSHTCLVWDGCEERKLQLPTKVIYIGQWSMLTLWEIDDR
jgi:hypothetical protein